MKCPTWRNSSRISKTSKTDVVVLFFYQVRILKKVYKIIHNKLAMAIVRAVFVCRLYRERLSQVNSKLAEVEVGRAAEYLEPLAVLLENMQVRTKVAGNFNTQTHP